MEIIGLTFAKWLWKMSDSKELGRGPFLTSGSLLAPGWGALLLRRRCIWIPWSWGVSGTWCVVKIISFPPSEKRPDLWICTVSTQGCNPSFLTLLPPVCDSYGAILFIRVFFFFSKETSHKNQPCPDLLINNHQQTRLRPPATHCCVSRSVASVSLLPYGLYPARLLCPWDSLGKNTRVGCCALLQGNLSHLQSNPGLLHCRQTLPSEPLGKTSNLHWHFF